MNVLYLIGTSEGFDLTRDLKLALDSRSCIEGNMSCTGKEDWKYLKASGIRVVCATEKGKMNYTQASFAEPVCVVMGAEDKGIPQEHLALCDDWVAIPQFGTIESLNVSVATGVILYEAVRQRQLKGE